MASFDAVNYSLRPNKTIQRALVFEGLRELSGLVDWSDAIYIGFGSIWFTDFLMAHKRLGIDRMLSIESDEIGFRRAEYNRPFRTVSVVNGLSYEVVPGFYEDRDMMSRPWIVWLDYDSELSDDAVEEVRKLLEQAPDDSALIVTIDASEKKYGTGSSQKRERLRTLLGDVVPDRIAGEALRETDAFASTMTGLFSAFMKSAADNCARPGGFETAFKMAYRDKAAMVTVGGLLPSEKNRGRIRERLKEPSWVGFPDVVIAAPHLTFRELAVLQAQMPSLAAIDRATVQGLGFDLGVDQIEVFRRYYRHYPAFAQLSA